MLLYITIIFKPKIPGHTVCLWHETCKGKAFLNPEPVVPSEGLKS